MGKHNQKKSHKTYKSSKLGTVICILQLALSAVLAFLVIKLGVLPNKYLFMGIGVLAIAFVLVLVLSLIHTAATRIISIILGILICVALCFGIFYVHRVDTTLDDITGKDTTVATMVVVVRADSDYSELSDVKNETFAYQNGRDREYNDLMFEQINKELDTEVTTKEYNMLESEISALLNGNINVAVYNSGFDDLLGELYTNYSDKVKVIYSYEIENKMTKVSEVSVDKPFILYLSGIDQIGRAHV